MYWGLLHLLLATFVFVSSHFLLSSHGPRRFLCHRFGTRRFLLVYSGLASIFLLWMIVAYSMHPLWTLWQGPVWVQYLPLFVMPLALYLIIEGYMLPNPMKVAGSRAFDDEQVLVGVLKLTRHPILWGVALWAFSHICANGDIGSVIFFGGFMVLALGGSLHIDRRRRARFPARFARFAALTSYWPLGAVVSGRARFTVADIRWWPLGLTLVTYLALLLVHNTLFGVSPWPVV